MAKRRLHQWLPADHWLVNYRREHIGGDLLAALVVTIMLVPQGLAYALLAGTPPATGLYAAMLPLLIYGLFASSRTLSVGPAALTSLLTASTAGALAQEPQYYLPLAIALALLSGAVLVLMALLRLGWLSNLLSHPVVTGFISACALLIALSQLPYLLGLESSGKHVFVLLQTLARQLPHTHGMTLALSALALVCLLLPRGLARWQSQSRLMKFASKTGPILAVVVTTLISATMDLPEQGVTVVGAIPAGLPSLGWPNLDSDHWQQLLVPALLLALIGFVESISLAQSLASFRRERLNANRELMGLGLANIASGLSGSFAVTGSFSRSTVNVDAGARTPLAGILAALGITLIALFFTDAFRYLPLATLGTIILVSVLPLVKLGELRTLWQFSRADCMAMAITVLGVLLIGIETGLMLGVGLSIALFLQRTSQPHVAELGRIPGTHHFRNMDRHQVHLADSVFSIRVDESLYFGNARQLEEQLYNRALQQPEIEHMVLHCSGINHLDASAVASLENLNQRLTDAGVRLHLSNVKGPVMDKLERTDFMAALSGNVYLSHYEAMEALVPESLEES